MRKKLQIFAIFLKKAFCEEQRDLLSLGCVNCDELSEIRWWWVVIDDVVDQNCNFINNAVFSWQPVKIFKSNNFALDRFDAFFFLNLSGLHDFESIEVYDEGMSGTTEVCWLKRRLETREILWSQLTVKCPLIQPIEKYRYLGLKKNRV